MKGTWAKWTRSRPASQRRRRGVALLMVLATIAMLTTSILEFVFRARVDLALAVNARDEVKAYYNARSGVNLLRLALQFQFQLSSEGGMISRAVEQSNFQLWQYLDLFLPTFVSARLDSPLGSLDLDETGAIGFGNLEGNIIFHDPIPEEGKVNLNNLAGENPNQETLLELCNLMAPPQYDHLFGPTRIGDTDLPTRGELIGAIIDHIDSDDDLVEVDDNCQIVPSGYGAESRRYRNLPYGPKNEPFTTLDEVLLVPGMRPEIFELFRNNLTVYLVVDRFFVNLADAQGFMGFLCANVLRADPTINMCRDPLIATEIAFLSLALEGWNRFFSSPFALLDYYLGFSSGQAQRQVADGIAAGQMIGFRTRQDFNVVLNLFRNNPEIAFDYAILADPWRAQLFGLMASGGMAMAPTRLSVNFDEGTIGRRVSVDTPRIYTVSATGIYGSARRTITAVVDFTENGRLLYWREF